MSFSETVSVPVRLSKLVLELVNELAKRRHMTRSTWIREMILQAIQQQQQQADIDRLEERLMLQIAATMERINQHITAEIDTLTRE